MRKYFRAGLGKINTLILTQFHIAILIKFLLPGMIIFFQNDPKSGYGFLITKRNVCQILHFDRSFARYV